MNRSLVPLAALLVACAGAREPGAWRDQLVFVGDSGTVLPLGLTRRTNGTGELKAWLGRAEAWQSWLYRRFAVRPDELTDTAAVLGALRRSSGTRVSLNRERGTLALDVRDGATTVHLAAPSLARLGESEDPEGLCRYRAGRATLVLRDSREDGWLLTEETPAERPHRPFVDYGDFVFVVAATPDRIVALKRSRRSPAFDAAWARVGDTRAHPSRFSVEVGARTVDLSIPDVPVRASMRIADRTSSDGVAPDGAALLYEVLLLRGDMQGVAFTSRRRPRRSRPRPPRHRRRPGRSLPRRPASARAACRRSS